MVNTIESVLDHDVKNNKLKKYLIKECSISYMSLCDENFDKIMSGFGMLKGLCYVDDGNREGVWRA